MNKLRLLGCALLCAGTIAQAQSVRLKAAANFIFHNADFRIVDTSTYNYSFGRSFVNTETTERTGWNRWAADEVGMLRFSEITGQNIDAYKSVFEYDNVDRIKNSYKSRFVNNNWDTVAAYHFHYNTSGIDTYSIDNKNNGIWAHSQRTIYVWGQDGVVTQIWQGWNGNISQYVNQQRINLSYTSGQLTQVLGEQWDGGAWQPLSRQTYTYVGDNIATSIMEQYNNGWENSNRWLYSYDVNDDAIIVEDQMWSLGIWKPMSRRLNTYNSDHSLLIENMQGHDNGQWVNWLYKTITYNMHNLIETSVTSEWDDVTGQFNPEEGESRKALYYYEEFDPSSISAVQEQSAFHVYPNPANNNININLHATQDRPFAITIFDATGKSVRHWNEAPTTFYQKQVDVSNLPSGSYFLRIDNRPNESVQFTVIR